MATETDWGEAPPSGAETAAAGPWNRWSGHGHNPAPIGAWVDVLYPDGGVGYSQSEARCWDDSEIIAWRLSREV